MARSELSITFRTVFSPTHNPEVGIMATLMWQRAALTVLTPMLKGELARDVHIGFLSGAKFREAVDLLAFRAQVAVHVDRGRVPLQ
jgi:hypothetical protein